VGPSRSRERGPEPEPPWPGQRFYAVRGDERVELEELRNTKHAHPVRVGDPIILGPKASARSPRPRRYVVTAVEDGGDTVLLGLES